MSGTNTPSPGSGATVIRLVDLRPVRLGALIAQPDRKVLLHDDGREQALEPRVMQVLVALADANGGTVSRVDLIDRCWDGRLVSDHAINRVISRLRAVSGGIGAGSFSVETLNKLGYRLIVAPPLNRLALPPDAPGEEQPLGAERPHSRRTMLAGGVVVAAIGFGGLYLARRSPPSNIPGGQDLVLMVLPFGAEGGEPALASLARGASEAMRADVGRMPSVGIIAAASSAAIAREQLSAPEIGRRTGATLLLDGSLAHEGDSFRLLLTLTDTGAGRQIWSSGIRYPAADTLGLQQAASAAVMEQLAPRLKVAAAPLPRDTTRRDPEAYRLSGQAKELMDQSRSLRMADQLAAAFDCADQAERLVRQALAIDGDDSNALLVMAQLTREGATRRLAAARLTTEERVKQAISYVRQALRADPDNPATLAMLGDYYRRFEWRWEDAETLFRRALAINPSLSDAHWSYSHQLATLGRALEGLDHALTLFQLDPENPWRRITLPRLLYLCGLRSAALQRYDIELSLAPDNLFLLYELYYMHLMERDAGQLRQVAARVVALWKGRTIPAGVRSLMERITAAIEALSGQPARLLALLDADLARLDAGGKEAGTVRGRARDDLPFILAMEYASAGRFGTAIELLDRALAAKSLYWPASLPFGQAQFPAPVRKDPRFQALWQRDARLADAVERRHTAVAAGQMAGFRADGRQVVPAIAPELMARVRRIGRS